MPTTTDSTFVVTEKPHDGVAVLKDLSVFIYMGKVPKQLSSKENRRVRCKKLKVYDAWFKKYGHMKRTKGFQHLFFTQSSKGPITPPRFIKSADDMVLPAENFKTDHFKYYKWS